MESIRVKGVNANELIEQIKKPETRKIGIQNVAQLPWHSTAPEVYVDLLPVSAILIDLLMTFEIPKDSNSNDNNSNNNEEKDEFIVLCIDALKNIAQHGYCKKVLATEKNLVSVLVPKFLDYDPTSSSASSCVRHVLALEVSDQDSSVAQKIVEECKVVPALVSVLKRKLASLQVVNEIKQKSDTYNTEEILFVCECIFRVDSTTVRETGMVENIDIIEIAVPILLSDMVDGEHKYKKRACAIFKTFAKYSSPSLKRDLITKYPVIQSLTSAMSSTSVDIKTRAAFCIWSLIQASHGSKVKEEVLKSGIINMLLNNFDIYACRGALQVISGGSNYGIDPLINAGCVGVVREFLKRNPSDSLSVFLLVNLIGKEEASEFKMDENINDILIKHLSVAVSSVNKCSRAPIAGSTQMETFHLTEILWCLSNLAINQANQEKLATQAVIDSLKQCSEMSDLRIKYQRVALRTLSQLVFVKSSHPYFLQNNGIEFFQRMSKIYEEDREVVASISGILWELNNSNNSNNNSNNPVVSTPATMTKTTVLKVMLSYSWATQAVVLKVADFLKTNGYEVWIDVEKMEGDIMSAMATAIDQSTIVCVAVSRGYHDSANCKRELAYAFRKKKPVIFFLVDEDYSLDGWLALYVSDSLYIDLRSRTEAALQQGLRSLTHQIKLMLSSNLNTIDVGGGSNNNNSNNSNNSGNSNNSSDNSKSVAPSANTNNNNNNKDELKQQLDRIEKKLDDQQKLLEQLIALKKKKKFF